MKHINDSDVEFKNKISGSKYLFTAEGKYAFGTAYLRQGDEIKEHLHADEQELFYFISGSPVFKCAGQSFNVKPGDSFLVEAGETHAISNKDGETAHLNFIKIKI
ncbi:MAG: cupin domain-containing protein [Candidatus Goldiibacteriota bacterium]|jgi:mannose-6-phosphate isomerase-like protein (cupin superfamily)